MRYVFSVIALSLVLLACNSEKKRQPATTIQTADSSLVKPAKDFSKLQFDYNRDPVCRMPLTAGIGDTATYKGKLYGFCSPECKGEFEKDPATYIAKMQPKK